MYSKFVLAIRFCSAEMAILVGKWPMADCYFKLCIPCTNTLEISLKKPPPVQITHTCKYCESFLSGPLSAFDTYS